MTIAGKYMGIFSICITYIYLNRFFFSITCPDPQAMEYYPEVVNHGKIVDVCDTKQEYNRWEIYMYIIYGYSYLSNLC